MRDHIYDKLDNHEEEKGIFKSPINKIGNITTYSWMKDCFPDFIWVALIIDYYGHGTAFTILSFIFKDIEKLSFKLDSLQLSCIFSLDEDKQVEF